MDDARCADLARGREWLPVGLRRSTARRLRRSDGDEAVRFGEPPPERLPDAEGVSESSLSVSDHADTCGTRRPVLRLQLLLTLCERWRIGLESRWKTSAPIAWVKLPPACGVSLLPLPPFPESAAAPDAELASLSAPSLLTSVLPLSDAADASGA